MVAVNCRTVKRRFKARGMGQAMQSSQGGTGGLSQLTINWIQMKDPPQAVSIFYSPSNVTSFSLRRDVKSRCIFTIPWLYSILDYLLLVFIVITTS
jgi:hypothetical protein